MNSKPSARVGWHSLNVLKKLKYKTAKVQQKLLNGQAPTGGHLLD